MLSSSQATYFISWIYDFRFMIRTQKNFYLDSEIEIPCIVESWMKITTSRIPCCTFEIATSTFDPSRLLDRSQQVSVELVLKFLLK